MKNKTYYLGFIYFCSMLGLVLLRHVSAVGILSSNGFFSASRQFTLFAQLLCMGAIPLGLYFILYKKFNASPRILGFKHDFAVNRVRRSNWKDIILISLLATFVIGAVSVLWQGLLTLIGYSSGEGSGGTAQGTLDGLVTRTVFVAVLPALFEEIANRGVVYGAYYNSRKPFKYVLMSALLFALMHQNITQTGYAFVAGLFMALLVHYTNSIVPAIVFHFTNNFLTVLRASTQVGAALNTVYAFLFGTVLGWFVSIIVMGFVIYFMMRAYARIRQREHVLVPVRFYDAVIYANRFSDFSAHTVVLPRNAVKNSALSGIFFYAAIALNVLVTGYTLYWGLIL